MMSPTQIWFAYACVKYCYIAQNGDEREMIKKQHLFKSEFTNKKLVKIIWKNLFISIDYNWH